MSVVYKTTDVIKVKVDNVYFDISPLNYKVKADMQAKVIAGKPMDAAIIALKNSIKGVEGLKNPDKSDYSATFDEDGTLSEDTINDLLNIPEATKLNSIAIGLINGMPQGEFLDPVSGKPMDGVKLVDKKASTRKKKVTKQSS